MTVLEGFRVVDCSDGTAGPLAAMVFADFGADVVKVEPPGGLPGRARPDFAVWNRGKRSAVVSDDRLATMVAEADVCVVNAPIDQLIGTPIDPALATAANPRLVYLHTPPYTRTAPWIGGEESDQLLAAATGVGLRQASFEGGPVDAVYPHLVTVQGLWAAATAVAALIERERSGRGQIVTAAGVHGMMIAAAGALTFDPSLLARAVHPGPGGPGGSVPFYRTYQCGDGEWLFLAALTPRFTEIAFRTLGVTDMLDDPRLAGRGRAAIIQHEHARWAMDRIASVMRTRSRSEWIDAFAAAGCPAGPLCSRDDWLDHPQLAAIGMRVEVEDPERGRVVMPGVPVVLTSTPGVVRGPAPAVGEHDGFPEWSSPRATSSAPAPPRGGEEATANGPLAGLRVLDLGAIIAGPFAASLLAELGADVIKVEPLTGDSFRGPGFAAYNKGQRGVALDLRHPDGLAAFLRLAQDADVAIDNYRPGVLGRLGIGYEQLAARNPGIVSLSITGFGQGGPLGEEAGFDPILQAMSGMMTAQGGDSDPVMFTVPVDDVAAAATGALGACLALLHRQRGGGGQRVWTSLAAMAAMLQTEALVRFPGRRPSPIGGADHPGPSPTDRYYRVRDGWVRLRSADAVKPIADLDREAAVARLTAAGIPAVSARTVQELCNDEELIDFGVLARDGRPRRETWWTTGRHARFSRTERSDILVAPSLGQHTREVLLEVGLSAEEITALVQGGAARAAE